jgi:hypothetical protein
VIDEARRDQETAPHGGPSRQSWTARCSHRTPRQHRALRACEIHCSDSSVRVRRETRNEGVDCGYRCAGRNHCGPCNQCRSARSAGRLSVVLRTSLPANLLEPQIRHEIQSIDPGLPVFNVSSMNDILDRSLASRRFSADLVGGFAGLAVLLASIGIYGLLAYMVSQRSREIGIRMALGARRGDILRMFLRKGVALAGVGIVAGLVVSASTASMMAGLLYGVRPHDPAVFLIVPLLLLAVAALASYLPARRATKVNPIVALREG